MSRVELLISVLEQSNIEQLLYRMEVNSDAVITNQADREEKEILTFRGHRVVSVTSPERGVGKSRKRCLLESQDEIVLFADQDMIYETGYASAIEAEFDAHPEADMILFNVDIEEERRTFHNEAWKRVKWYNCGRYGAVTFAIRREKLLATGVEYSLLFGGGAKYLAGEDSMFLKDLMDAGIKVYASPVTIGREAAGESTWFRGYDERFFHDRGVLYHFLYGHLATAWSLRFLLAHKAKLCKDIPLAKAFSFMRNGIKEGCREHSQK